MPNETRGGEAGAVSVVGAVDGTAALVDVNTGVAADAVGTIPAATGRRLLGFVAEESATVAAAAEIRLRHGSAAGVLIDIIKLAADGVDRRWWGPNGISVPNGVTIDWVSGQVDINLFYA